MAADHLSRLENPNVGELTKTEIADEFPDEHLMILKAKLNDDEPCYADYVNYIVKKVVPSKWMPEKRKRFFSQVRNYFWDEPYAFRLCLDNVMRRCVAGDEIFKILAHCHSGPTRGHHSASVTRRKVYELGFFWPDIFNDAKDYVMKCDACQKSENISSRSEMPQNNIQVCDVFDVWGLDLMGPFPDSRGRMGVIPKFIRFYTVMVIGVVLLYIPNHIGADPSTPIIDKLVTLHYMLGSPQYYRQYISDVAYYLGHMYRPLTSIMLTPFRSRWMPCSYTYSEQVVKDDRTGAVASVVILHITIYNWLEPSISRNLVRFEKAVAPVDADEIISHMEKISDVIGFNDAFKTRLAVYKFEGDLRLLGGEAYKHVPKEEMRWSSLLWVSYSKSCTFSAFPSSMRQERLKGSDHSIRQRASKIILSTCKAFTLRLAGFLGQLLALQKPGEELSLGSHNQSLTDVHVYTFTECCSGIRCLDAIKVKEVSNPPNLPTLVPSSPWLPSKRLYSTQLATQVDVVTPRRVVVVLRWIRSHDASSRVFALTQDQAAIRSADCFRISDVFPEELLGIPPIRDVEFNIELIPGAESGFHQKDRKPKQMTKTEHRNGKLQESKPKSKNAQSKSLTEESAVKPEPELKNTIECNLNPSDGPGKPNSISMKTVKTKWALNHLQQPICVQLTKTVKTLKAQS
ncbi:reverse transcriptase domain-containing protein [Tanacetum coccineum]